MGEFFSAYAVEIVKAVVLMVFGYVGTTTPTAVLSWIISPRPRCRICRLKIRALNWLRHRQRRTTILSTSCVLALLLRISRAIRGRQLPTVAVAAQPNAA